MARESKDSENGSASTQGGTKKCFVVSEFGRDEATRLERKQTLKHLVRKVLEPMGYQVQRADDIEDLGQITHQIIERLLDDDLVIADLTGLNPNVFYELAVRHAARKPVITLMTEGQAIPFDLKDVRTIFYDLHSPDSLEAAQQGLSQKVLAIEENPTEIRNPITVATNVTLLRHSNDPEARAAGAVLAALNELQDEVRALGRRVSRAQVQPGAAVIRTAAYDDLLARIRGTITASRTNLSTAEVAERLHVSPETAEQALAYLKEREDGIYLVDGRWTDIPF